MGNELNYRPARQENETFEAYKLRRVKINAEDKRRQRGALVWDSANKATYRRSKHGELPMG